MFVYKCWPIIFEDLELYCIPSSLSMRLTCCLPQSAEYELDNSIWKDHIERYTFRLKKLNHKGEGRRGHEKRAGPYLVDIYTRGSIEFRGLCPMNSPAGSRQLAGSRLPDASISQKGLFVKKQTATTLINILITWSLWIPRPVEVDHLNYTPGPRSYQLW